MPANDCLRLDDDQRRTPVGPESRQHGPKRSITRTQLGALARLLENGQLLTERQFFVGQLDLGNQQRSEKHRHHLETTQKKTHTKTRKSIPLELRAKTKP